MANKLNSLAHTKQLCKYHIKYRHKAIFNQYRRDLEETYLFFIHCYCTYALCMYAVCMFTSMYVCDMYMHVCISMYLYLCIYVCIYVCVYI